MIEVVCGWCRLIIQAHSLFGFVFCYSQRQDQWCRPLRYPNTCCVGVKRAELWTVQGSALTSASVGSSCLPAERRATLSQIVVPLLNHHTIKRHLRTKPGSENNTSALVQRTRAVWLCRIGAFKGEKIQTEGSWGRTETDSAPSCFQTFKGSLYFPLWPLQWGEGTAGGQ